MTAAQDSREPSPSHAKTEKDRPGAEDNGKVEENISEPTYPTGGRLVIICLALCLTVFISALSNTIVATAVPTITAAFHSYDDIGWYTSGELITSCAFILPFGAAYSIFNLKWTFLSSLLIYLVGSAICGAAPSSVVLIIGRAIAGIGSSGIFSGAFIIIAKCTPLEKRSIFNGLVGATFTVASVGGPLIGGAFTTGVTWRWCFYFNLPVGVVPAVVIVFFIPSDIAQPDLRIKDMSAMQVLKKLDPIGTILVLGFVISLLLALQFGGTEYSWSDYRTIVCFVISGVLLLVWLFVQWRQGDEATVPFSILKSRTVASALPYSFLNGASFLIAINYISIWFQAIRGDSAQSSGIKQLALIISVSLSTVLSGVAISKLGYYSILLLSGTVLTSLGAGLLYTLDPTSTLGEIIGFQILYGVGVGMGLNSATIAVQTVLPKEQIAKGTSAEIFARQFGGALGSPIGQSVLSQALIRNLGKKVAGKVFQDGSVTGALSMLKAIYSDSPQRLTAAVLGFNNAVTSTFLLALILSCLTLPFALVAERKSVKGSRANEGNSSESEFKEKSLE